jgi:hypothetical protein
MLSTEIRMIYLDELKPPEGYEFDRALATTFTLDLLALLMAPLTVSLFNVESKEEVLNDPLLIVEALRKTAGSISIFCQEGYISVPKTDSLLYSYLEPSVIQVKPQIGNGIFHPKTWIMRFVSKDMPVLYRFLCLSRNLTFDRSWDTVLKLEGIVADREIGYGRNKSLYDFIDSLKNLAIINLNKDAKKNISIIQNEIRKVAFEVPDNFDDELTFYPSGIDGHFKQRQFVDFDRCLIISPFLTGDIVSNLSSRGNKNILISKSESLDTLDDNQYKSIKKTTDIFIMEEGAEEPEEIVEETSDNSSSNLSNEVNGDVAHSNELRGLHAKLYIQEIGWNAEILTGSANATFPAFSGQNVEFMIGLNGKKSKVGIDRFIGNGKDSGSFMNLLRPYKRLGNIIEADDDITNLKELLNISKKALLRLCLKIIIHPNDDDTYSLLINGNSKDNEIPQGVTIKCYPITLKEQDAVLYNTAEENGFIFRSISLASLTTFIAFNVTAVSEKRKASESFVLNLPAEGMPEDRDKNILLKIIKDKNRFIRYLLLILSDNPNDILLDELLSATSEKRDNSLNGENEIFIFENNIPFLEELVRAFSRSREKIERIQRLIEDIKSANYNEDIIPEHFEKTWVAFIEAMKPSN